MVSPVQTVTRDLTHLLTETVANWEAWFASDTLPAIRRRVRQVLGTESPAWKRTTLGPDPEGVR